MIFDEEYYRKTEELASQIRRERLYSVYGNIKNRCYNKNTKNYDRYGGRGIKMCDEWKNSFNSFYKWSIENGFTVEIGSYNKNKLSIDRINNDGDYCPENCRWTTRLEQANNKSTNHNIEINGEVKNIASWARFYKVPDYVIRNSVYKNKDILLAVKQYKEKNAQRLNRVLDKRYTSGVFICSNKNDALRIYKVDNGFELRCNFICENNPIYFYKSLNVAKLVMRNKEKGIYGLIQKLPSMWE